MKKSVTVRGVYADLLLWICNELDETPEGFLQQILPYHAEKITAVKKAIEEKQRESKRVSEGMPEDSSGGAVPNDTDAAEAGGLESGSGG